MDRNLIGLYKYIAIILLSILPPIIFFEFCLNFKLYEYYPFLLQFDFSLSIFMIFLELFLVFASLLLQITTTIFAIKHHWSSYLDNFFNQLKLPTIILLFVILMIYIYENGVFYEFSNSTWGAYLYRATATPYCLIYIVILINNIIKHGTKEDLSQNTADNNNTNENRKELIKVCIGFFCLFAIIMSTIIYSHPRPPSNKKDCIAENYCWNDTKKRCETDHYYCRRAFHECYENNGVWDDDTQSCTPPQNNGK